LFFFFFFFFFREGAWAGFFHFADQKRELYDPASGTLDSWTTHRHEFDKIKPVIYLFKRRRWLPNGPGCCWPGGRIGAVTFNNARAVESRERDCGMENERGNWAPNATTKTATLLTFRQGAGGRRSGFAAGGVRVGKVRSCMIDSEPFKAGPRSRVRLRRLGEELHPHPSSRKV